MGATTGVYAYDEQITVEVERTAEGVCTGPVHVHVPGQTQHFVPSEELRRRHFPSEPDAAIAAVDELKSQQPELLASWARREGFF
jgi:hypothetical protein